MNTSKTDKFVDIDTHKLRVVLSDNPSKTTIILEAGGGEFSDAYREIQDKLAIQSGLRVLSYDRSGFGQSELGPEDFKAIDEVHTLKKCLDQLGFEEDYILVGHSYGGLLVQLFTMEYPEAVRGLVLIDPMNVSFVDKFGLDNLNAMTPYYEKPKTNDEKAGNRMTDQFAETLDLMRGITLPQKNTYNSNNSRKPSCS